MANSTRASLLLLPLYAVDTSPRKLSEKRKQTLINNFSLKTLRYYKYGINPFPYREAIPR